MEDVEKRALSTFHSPPKIWKRYVDDTFVIIHKNSVEDFLDHLNTIENSIKFTIEKEADHTLPFLDTLVRRNKSTWRFLNISLPKTNQQQPIFKLSI